MSLMKTLAKVALGVAVAKGISTVMNKNQGQGGLLGRSASAQTGGGIGDMLGNVLGGGGQQGGGLGGLLDKLGGGASGNQGGALDGLLGGGQQGGGLADMLGGLTGGAAAGGIGGLLSGMVGGNPAQPAPQQAPQRPFGEIFNAELTQSPPPVPPTPEQDAMAGLLLAAMIQAAQADGEIDAGEREKLLGQLKDAGPEEQAFVQQQLAAPVDIDRLVRATPKGAEEQVYLMSIMAIQLDNQKEAEYLHRLGEAFGLSKARINEIHAELGAPKLYA